jgi:hypothetical protein
MKHSGLQKSISSIFDGTEPVKQETAATIQAPAQPRSVAAAPVTPTVTPPVTVSASPLTVAISQSPSADLAPAGRATTPQVTRPATRPRPVPKKNTVRQETISIKDLWKTFKSRLTGGSKGSLDSRQKKTVILGIGLAIVFVAVLLFALGSGPSGVKADSKKAGKEGAAGSVSGNSDNWQKPEIYPLSLRDPMKPSSGSKTNDQAEGEMTVRGIVYSSVNPSAIIANQIVYEGDVILGVKIVKIGKDFVAFEKKGKQWQQQVRQ